MRKKLTILFWLVCAAVALPAHAHKEWVHQYMVKQAYLYLENSIGEIPALRSAVGLNYANYFTAGEDYRPFNTGIPIAIGAWREDKEDVVYGYKASDFPDLNDFTPSVTHFWRGDLGDYDRLSIGNRSFENAWMKARVLLFCELSPYEVRIPWQATTGGYVDDYVISYTSLPELYKGNFYLKYVDQKYNGSRVYYNQAHTGDVSFARGFPQAVALQLLGRVAHLLSDMGVPAHAHKHLHPCPLYKPDKFEQHLGNTYYSNNGTSECENFPGPNGLPAYDWTAATAANQGALLNDMYCIGSNSDKMRFLFYTQNELADFFPSGVDASDSNKGVQSKVAGNNLAQTNQYIAAAYGQFGNTPPGNIDPQQIANVTFNFGIRATATLFQWFAFEAGIITDLRNTRLVGTAPAGNYLLCDGGPSIDLHLTPSTAAAITWSIEPSGVATGTAMMVGGEEIYRVSPVANGYNGAITVSASYSSSYSCATNYVTASKTLWKGPPVVNLLTRDEYNGDYGGYPDREPNTSVDVVATVEMEQLQPPLQYTWSLEDYDPDVRWSLMPAGPAAVLGFAREYSQYATVRVVVSNACGSATATRAFATRYRDPGETCLICPPPGGGFRAATAGGGAAGPEAGKKQLKGAAGNAEQSPDSGFMSIYPNPSNTGFTLQLDAATAPKPGPSEASGYTLFDAVGKQLLTGHLESASTFVNTSAITNGVYFLKITTAGHTEIKRIQIMH